MFNLITIKLLLFFHIIPFSQQMELVNILELSNKKDTCTNKCSL